MAETIQCARCGRENEIQILGTVAAPPEGWEGSIFDAICPGCQFIEWHPHCTSLRAEHGYGDRIDTAALERGESITVKDVDDDLVVVRSFSDLEILGVGRCEYIDYDVRWIDDAGWPKAWTCSQCGGTEFEGVHPDYTQSGLKGSSFSTDAER